MPNNIFQQHPGEQAFQGSAESLLSWLRDFSWRGGGFFVTLPGGCADAAACNYTLIYYIYNGKLV